MEYVVQDDQSVILQSTETSSNILEESLGNVKVEVPSTSLISQVVQSTILINTSTPEVILAGAMGPRGLAAEDIDVYSKRIDFISENELYKGEAAVGSSEASPLWRIRKVVIAVDNDVSETWASGTADFDKIWANRAALVYS